jgi:two-component system cell cycle sensor histidine kinase/response regulator CckA
MIRQAKALENAAAGGKALEASSFAPAPRRESGRRDEAPEGAEGMRRQALERGDKARMTSLSTMPPSSGFERMARPGLMAIMLLAVVASVAALVFLPGDFGREAVSFTIAILAIFGVFSILMYAFGLARFVGRASQLDLARAIVETEAEALIVTAGGSRVLYANDAYRVLSGGRGREAPNVERLFQRAPETAQAIYRLAQAARAAGTAVEELRLSPPLSGAREAAWYRVRVRPIEGQPTGDAALWTIADITAERESHEKFFKDLQHAIDYLDHAPAGFFSAESDGAIAYMNATLASWLDYDIAEFTPGQMTLSDLVAANGAALLSVVAGAPGEVKTVDTVVDLKRRQGVSKPARLIHRVTFGPDGAPLPSHTLALEASVEAPRSESAEAAETRFSRMFNATPLPLASLNPDGLVRRANGAFAKLAPAAMKGGHATLFQAVVERDHAALRAAIQAAKEGKAEIAPVDATLEEGQRAARFFVSAAEPKAGEGGANVIALDMTEQRTLQESFAQSQKMQAVGQLAGGIAHDFNNVLTAIIGYSDLLLVNHRPTDPSFQDIMQIRQNANRAAGLVRQLLAFSRRQTLRPQVLQLDDVLSELQMMLRRLVGEKIELEVAHGRDLWLVMADLNQFEQVVVNLVVNARDAMAGGGRISLRTRNVGPQDCAAFGEKSLTPAEYVLVEVQDSGHGIPADVRDKIFEPFFTTKEVGKGTGLGLSMVYGIVKQTGGFVFCVSEPGQGATFRILLPRHIAEPVAEPMKKAEAAKPVADLTGRGAILLVEDEEAVRAFASRALASRGYTVLEADSGVDALRVLEEGDGQIDLIVSDVIMPEMDGPTMLMELRKRGVTSKIVFVSGYADDAFARNLPEGEEFQFLPKPFTLKQLIETVKGAMG